MKVKDVMTVNVGAVGQEATLKQVAELMVERQISGVPVINADRRVLGVVSEADIIVKAASRAESAGILGRIFTLKGVDERRLAATTAGEAMTHQPVTIDAEQSVAEAARLMVDHSVNRLPVVIDGELAGIVSRADIVQAFTRSDSEIWEELRNDVMATKLWISSEELDVIVVGGRVKVTGQVRTRTLAELIEAFAWRVLGVVSVDCSELSWEVDDLAPRSSHNLSMRSSSVST
jgi:CBS domain-containing protein